MMKFDANCYRYYIQKNLIIHLPKQNERDPKSCNHNYGVILEINDYFNDALLLYE